MTQRKHIFYLISQALLLGGAIAGAAITSRAADWTPLPLLLLLLVLAVVAEWFTVTIGGQTTSTVEFWFVLAATLLGPAPAVALGIASIVADTVRRRPPLAAALNNFATYAAAALLCGLLGRLMLGNVHASTDHALIRSPTFALAAFGVAVAVSLLLYPLSASYPLLMLRQSVASYARPIIPMLPAQLATAALTAILAVAYTNLGYAALLTGVIFILVVQYLFAALVRSEDRAEQLRARSLNLASLQLGVLVTLVETLAMRDRAVAKHAASVARYARALAAEIGCSETDQDLVHTAALLHDIGKFALPDRILHSQLLSDEDWTTVRRHPQDGATLVGRLDGYGPVADIILHHHEHVDGSGYPVGLIGNEIPLLARVLAVCNVYDTLTARDSYRPPMTPQDAIAELRRVAGHSLDEELVRSFVALLEREGPIDFTEGVDPSFETELAFERRARALAIPAAH